jgi:crotonyl-CoA reductase
VELLNEIGVEAVIDRKAEGYSFWDGDEQNPKEFRRFGKKIRELVGEDPDIVFEHPGRQTFGASVFVTKRGGTIVTCASTSGYMHEYDNRYLWLKRIIGSHFANYKEAWEANRLIDLGMIHPILSKTYPLAESGEAAYQVHQNLHKGKLGILVLAPQEGLGIQDEAKRAKYADKIEAFSRFSD